MTVNIENRWPGKKKSKTLIICQKNPFGGTIFEKIFIKFQESTVFEKMTKNQIAVFT